MGKQTNRFYKGFLIIISALKFRYNITLFFLIFFPGIIYPQNNYLRAKYFKLADGLSQVSCNNLLLDKSGFIWIATENGLNRFDGKEFKHFKYNESDFLTISENCIKKLMADKTGRIWIGTVGNGLNYYSADLMFVLNSDFKDIFERTNF